MTSPRDLSKPLDRRPWPKLDSRPEQQLELGERDLLSAAVEQQRAEFGRGLALQFVFPGIELMALLSKSAKCFECSCFGFGHDRSLANRCDPSANQTGIIERL